MTTQIQKRAPSTRHMGRSEMGDRESVSKARNYKSIISRTREIGDHNSDSDRRFTALIVARNGSLLAADAESKEICIYNRNGKQVKTFSVELAEYEDFLGIAELNNGNIAICGYDNNVIKAFTFNGEFVLEFDHKFESGELRYPGGITVNKDGQVFVTSSAESVSKVLVMRRESFNTPLSVKGLILLDHVI